MSTENYLRELRWKEINALRAEVEDWKDNYNKATDACVALRAENARLREALEEIATGKYDGTNGTGRYTARAALQKDEGK